MAIHQIVREDVRNAGSKHRFFFEIFVPVVLFLIAFAIRWPKLFEIPRFRSNELDITLKLVRGESFPLINQHSHIGALSNYIHALAFRLLGMHYWVPGFVTILAGSATVSLLYLWGRRIVSPVAAGVAALLFTCSLYHVYFLSHVPWSNCLTPFFTALVLLTFFIALQESRPGYLILSAFLFGLSFQTHPSVVTLIPALVVLFLIQGKEGVRSWIRRPAFYLTLPAALLACSNLIYYHFFTQAHRVKSPLSYPTKYALEEHPTASSYVGNTGKAWTLLMRLISAQVDTRPRIEHWENPVLLACAAFVILGLALAIRKKKYELPLMLLSPMFLIPAFNKIYGFCNFGRYEGFLLPVALLVMAFAATEIVRFAKTKGRGFAICGLAFIILAGSSLWAYHAFQLRRVYSVLQVDDSSMIFMKTRQLLLKNKFEKMKSVILVDAFSWHENQMKPFLLSDGWNVDRLTETDTINVKARNFLKPKFFSLPAQIRKYNARGISRVVILASPLILKPLLQSGNLSSYEGNLSAARIDRPNNLYDLLIGHIYYVFQGKSERASGTEARTDMPVFLRIVSYIPDDLYRALPGNRRGGPLRNPPDMPPESLKNLRLLLDETSTSLPDFPGMNSAICQPEPP